MIISAAKFKKFITQCIIYSRGMTGKRTPYFLDLYLTTENNTLFCSGISPDKNIMIDFQIPVECAESKNFYISDSLKFLKFLKDSKLKGKIEITLNGIINEGILFEYNLSRCDIHTSSQYPMYYNKIIHENDRVGYGKAGIFDTTIIARCEDINNAVKKNNYRYELFEYKFEVLDHHFFISILSRDGKEFKTEIPAIVTGIDCSGIYSIGIDCVFKNLISEVNIGFNKNSPMIVEDVMGSSVVLFPVEYLDEGE